MKQMSFFKKAACAAALAVAASTANAASIGIGDLLNVREGSGGIFGPSGLNAGVEYQVGSTTWNVPQVGILDLEAAHVGKSDWRRILAFCLEPNIGFGFDNPFEVVGGLSSDLKRMWATHFGSVDTDTEAAAFQVAIWELVVDTGSSLTSGNFRLVDASSDVGNQAAQYLDSTGWGQTLANLVRLRDNPQTANRQDLVIDVPTPSSLALLVLGLIGIGAVRRRAAKV